MSLTDRPELDDRNVRTDDEEQLLFHDLFRSDDLVIDITENRVDLLPPLILPDHVRPPAPDQPDDEPTVDEAVPTGELPTVETDRTSDGPEVVESDAAESETPDPGHRSTHTTPRAEARSAEPRRRPVRGLRLRRVRLRSVLAVSTLFFAVAYLTVVGTGVALWNAALRLGLVTDTENLVTTSLGLESFDVAGAQLFDLLVVGAGVLCILGLISTLLLAAVYNVAGMLFGGLAFETTPLPRRRGIVNRIRRRLRSR